MSTIFSLPMTSTSHEKIELERLREENRHLRSLLVEREAAQETQAATEQTASAQTEALHRFASEAGRTGSWYVRLDTQECMLSPIMGELMGFPPGKTRATVQEWRDCVAPADREALETALRTSSERDVPFDIEFRIVLPEGTERWLYSHGGVVHDASGQAMRLYGASVDLTERKQVELAQRESAARLGAALAVANLGTFEWDLLTGEVTLDARSREIFGFASEEGTQAQDVFTRIASEDFERVFAEAQQAQRERSRLETEYRLHLPDGAMRSIVSISHAVLDTNGNVVLMFGVFGDITERKRAEQALYERAVEIEALNVRLKQSMTETHHRVKNNLQVIAAMIEMQVLEYKHEQTVPIEEFVRLKAHVHTLAIVHDLLTKSIKESEDTQRISTTSVLDKLLPMLQQTAWKQTVRYAVDETELTSKQCIALSLVLNELVSNALKHGRKEAAVYFTVEGCEATLAVQDDGAGFSAGFDPRRAANTGLELVDSLVRIDLAGTVRYQNQPEGGGEVRVTFPLPQTEG